MNSAEPILSRPVPGAGDSASLPIRVLHVLAALDRGGAETWLMDLARIADPARVRMDVCTLSPNAGVYEPEFREVGGEIHRCLLRGNRMAFGSQFRDLLLRGRYDVVHSHVYYFSGVLLRLAARAGVPGRVAHIHRSQDLKPQALGRKLYTRWMQAWIHRYATSVLGPSRASLEGFFGSGWQSDPRRMVVYNGVRVARFRSAPDRAGVRRDLGLPGDARIVLNVGRFVWHKRQSLLVEAAAELIRLHQNLCFVFIGEGPQRQAIEAKAASLGASERFRFLAIGQPQIDRYFLASDVFAFPSESEGFGIVVAEAGAAGLPVVAADIPGVREAAEACAHTELLAKDAAPRAWAAAIGRCLEYPPAGEKDRAKWLESFRFTIEGSISALMDVYRSSCNLGR